MRSFLARLRFALQGVRQGLAEPNFRIQLVLATGALSLLLVIQPAALWWAVFATVIAGVLSAELLNTALEALCDAVHPEQHPLIKVAKDCAAGAVLVWSVAALLVLVAFLATIACGQLQGHFI